MKDKVRNGKPKCWEQIKGLGEEREHGGGGEAEPLQVAPSLPKRAGNSCHSLSNVRLPGAGPSTPSIPVS